MDFEQKYQKDPGMNRVKNDSACMAQVWAFQLCIVATTFTGTVACINHPSWSTPIVCLFLYQNQQRTRSMSNCLHQSKIIYDGPRAQNSGDSFHL